jgi:hypothetical protein
VPDRDHDHDDWRPPGARLRAALWQAETHFHRREFAAAARALEATRGLGADELVAALRHLAAAGYQAREGHLERAHRPLARARQRVAPFLPEAYEVELQPLLDAVAAIVESAGDDEELA